MGRVTKTQATLVCLGPSKPQQRVCSNGSLQKLINPPAESVRAQGGSDNTFLRVLTCPRRGDKLRSETPYNQLNFRADSTADYRPRGAYLIEWKSGRNFH